MLALSVIAGRLALTCCLRAALPMPLPGVEGQEHWEPPNVQQLPSPLSTHDMLRRIYQATMADQQPAAAAAAAGAAAALDAAPGGGEESLLSHLRTLSTTSVTDLRQQAGGPAGVVETLAGLASSSFVKQGAGAPPFPVVSTSASLAPAPAGAADAGAGGRAQGANAVAAAAASPQRQEECLLYLQTLTVHSSNLVGCIDSGIKLEAAATCVKAAGTAATCLRERRTDIARSGIIPALVEIATAYQRPAVPAAANENGGDANMVDASGEAGNGNGNGTADSNLPPCAVLTPAHPELVECCLLAGHYRAAIRLLTDIPVRTVSAAKTACMASAIDLQNEGTGAAAAAAASAAAGGSAAQPPSAPAAASASSSNLKKAASAKTLPGVTTETYLRYFYYLGMIRVGCDDLEGAVAAFSVCLTVPSHTVSAITIAARKKMLLCRCLLSDPIGPSDLAAASAYSDGDDKETAKRVRSTTRARLLSIHAAASPAVERFLSNASPDQPGQFPGGNIGRSSSSGSIKRSRGAAGDYYDDDVAMSPSAFDEGRRVSVRADSGAEDDAPETAVEQPSGADAGAEAADGKPKADGGGDGGDGGGGGAPTVDSARRLREGNSYNLGRYDSLVDAFASNDAKRFREVRESMANVLAVDGNAGLAEKVESDMQFRQVYAVAAVYEVVSLETLASDVGLKGRTAEAESLVRKMVAKGDISAKIDHESGMVYFVAADEDDDKDSHEEEEYRADLAGQMQQCIDLADRIRILDADITASSRYQQISLRKEANAKANAQSGEGDEGASSGTGGGPRGVADIR